MKTHLKKYAVGSAMLVAALAFAYQATATTLYKDGAIVSGNLKTIDGTTYVPVRDVAMFLGGTLTISNDRADITTTPPPTPAQGLPEAIAQEVPPISVPANPIATTAVAPPPLPAQLSAGLNQDVVFDGFAYRVTGVDYRDREYKDQYDQRGTKLHPQWKNDRLTVIEFTIKNVGADGGSPSIPGLWGFPWGLANKCIKSQSPATLLPLDLDPC